MHCGLQQPSIFAAQAAHWIKRRWQASLAQFTCVSAGSAALMAMGNDVFGNTLAHTLVKNEIFADELQRAGLLPLRGGHIR